MGKEIEESVVGELMESGYDSHTAVEAWRRQINRQGKIGRTPAQRKYAADHRRRLQQAEREAS